MAKYVFVTGGVTSSLGKGITAASVGRLLKSRGLSVSIIKLDPYINVDPGTMSPFQHGEVYVTDDGAETDLDLGHYERFTSMTASRLNNTTAGRVYATVIERERRGHHRVVKLRLALPGLLAAHHLVQEQPEEEDVRLGGARRPAPDDLLRGGVAAAVDHPQAGCLARSHRQRPVAGGLGLAGVGEHHRLRPEVAVHHRRAVVVARQVGVVSAEGHVGDDAGGDARRQRRDQVQHLAERLPVDELHHPGQPLLERGQAVHLDDVRVVELRGPPRLPAQLGGALVVPGQLRRRPDQDHRPPRAVAAFLEAEDGGGPGAGEQRPDRPVGGVGHLGCGQPNPECYCGRSTLLKNGSRSGR